MIAKVKSWFEAAPARRLDFSSAHGEPSVWEVLLMFVAVSLIHVLTVCRVAHFWDAALRSYDTGQYLRLAAFIGSWGSRGGRVPYHFWGFPYAIAAVSKLLPISQLAALVTISEVSSLAVCVLLRGLYGGWVAAAFVAIHYQWVVLSVEGGSEPLFICLLFASFLAARTGRWNVAACLASLSTTVRPVGVFALAGFAIVLGMRRSYRQLAAITLIGLGVGTLYVIPLWMLRGTPFANFAGYRAEDWGPHGRPLVYPFGTLIPSYFGGFGLGWPVLAFSASWLVVLLVGTVAIWLPRNVQRFSRGRQVEALFASMYALFLISYNMDTIVLHLPRFVIPVLPLILFSLRDWIPKDRRVLWTVGALSALLASSAMVGFKNVFGFRLR